MRIRWSILFAVLLAAVAADAQLQRLSSSADEFARFLSTTAPPKKHRSLFGGYTNVICSLSEETYPALWNANKEMYYFPDIESRLNGTKATENDVQNAIQEILGELSEGDYEMVRLCWCTQYAQLPYEFCCTL